MKQPLAYEQWVKKLVENLASYFDLAGWTLQVEFHEEEKGTSYAENNINSTYLGSTINVYPPAKKDFDAGNTDRLVMAMVHELVHLFADPFHEAILPFLSPSTNPAFQEILEQQTQRLTMVFLKNLPKGLIPPR
jgi:hypothetical protein